MKNGDSSPILEKPSIRRREEFLSAVRKSRRRHGRWTSAPQTPSEFDAYLKRIRRKTHLGYWVITEQRELAGVINVSEIVRGHFCSAYLGYYAFTPHDGRGYMTRGLKAVLFDTFRDQGLHRLEANIQPGNKSSRSLVERLGFRLEGFSQRYLKIAGRWRDHERWAITAEEWNAKNSIPTDDRLRSSL
jgi:ribosomal-protein-alanine N-acetyltransferase